MKKLLLLLLVACMVCDVAACAHKHMWVEATCTTPKTCSECGRTEGEPLGHTWKAATCTAPKTCSACGATEGKALGHTWKEATCTAPKTCSVCGATEGKALGHSWKKATCTAPKTCSVCGATEGEPAGHSWKAATCTAPKTCSVCGATEGEPAGHAWVDATETNPKTCSVCGATEGDPLPRVKKYFEELPDLKTPDSFDGFTFIKKRNDVYYYSLGPDWDVANACFADYQTELMLFDDYLIVPYKDKANNYAIYKDEVADANRKGVIVFAKDTNLAGDDVVMALIFE